MKVTAVIAECNPFHNGHAAVLRKAREKTGADYLIVILSGDYVQRGAPAIVEKYTRTRMALMSGADLVLELPLYYCLGSAEYFALGAVALINRLRMVDTLVFGCEHADITRLTALAGRLADEPPAFKLHLQKYLKQGNDFPTARAKALALCLPEEEKKDVALLDSPNNLLAVEYIKQLIRTKSATQAVAVRRTSGVSASAIRASLTGAHPRLRKAQMPESCAILLSDYPAHSGYDYATLSMILPQLKHLLALENAAGVSRIADVGRDMAQRLYKALPVSGDMDTLVDTLHTKDMTEARVRRALMHIFLHMTKENADAYAKAHTVYARVLGFKKSASPLMNRLKSAATLPLITKLAQSARLLSEDPLALRLLQEDIRSSYVYDQCFLAPESYPLKSEYEKPVITV